MLLKPPILCQFYAQFIHSIKHLQSAHHDPGTVPGNGCEQASKRNQLLYLCHLHSGCNQSVPFILIPSLLPSLMLPLSRIQLFVTTWTVAHLAPLSMEFSKQEYWILEWVAMPSPRGLLHPGIKPRSFVLQAGSLPSEPPGKQK